MKTMNFDAIATSAPLNREASTARDGSGDLWEAKLSPDLKHWKAPPPPESPLPSGMMDLAGHRFGRLTVIRFHGRSGKSTPRPVWLVRCQCGDYEVRRTETIMNNTNPDAACTPCELLKGMQKRAGKPGNKARRRAEAARLDALARRS